MTLFIGIATAMVLIALSFVLPPLLGWARGGAVARDEINAAIFRDRVADLEYDRNAGTIDEEEQRQLRAELERELLADTAERAPAGQRTDAPSRRGHWMALAVAIAVPALAAGLYWALSVRSLGDGETIAVSGGAPQVETMVANLAQQLKRQPDNAKGWLMLGRSYLVLQRYPDAAKAFAHAHALLGDVPDLLADYAEALSMANGASMTGKPSALVAKALAADPNNIKALWLAGAAAYQHGDKAAAIEHWRHVLVQLPPGSDDARTVEATIKRIGGGSVPAPSPASR